MKKPTPLLLLGLAGLGAALSAPALAQDARYALDSPYFYGGLSVGQSNSQINEQTTSNTLRGFAQTPLSMGTDRDDAAYKLFGGYQFNRNFGVELGYFNLGKFSYAATMPSGPLNGRYEIEGANLDLVGTMPLSQRWSLQGRIGAQWAETRGSFSGAGLLPATPGTRTQQDTNAKVGLGLQYEISPSVLLRGEAERYRVKDSVNNWGDVNVYSLSLVFPFGRKAPRPAPPPPPAPVAVIEPPPPVAPPPPPVVMPPPPPPAPVAPPPPQRVHFAADSLFAFGKADLSPSGKTALDKFLSDLSGTHFSTIVVEGHTDRIGSEQSNQKLSQRRAETVRNYLVGAGVDAGKISASGKGESQPVTKPEDCKGNKATKALIACLQPDRRVEVEVNGERPR